MKTLFDPDAVEELKTRLAKLQPESPRRWGSMTATQVLAHCSAGLGMTMGDIRPPRAFIGRILGPLIKPKAVGNDEQFRRNSPTVKELLNTGQGDFATERQRLCDAIDRVASAGPQGCTTHPHPFFGEMTPIEWSNLAYKHIDHHLRQFGT